MITSHMATAEAVLAAIKAICPDELDASYEAYCNGREQGYNISGKDRRVSFSEHRNTDDIIVYYGGYGDFDMGGNIPSDEVYRRQSRGFEYGHFFEAAVFIIEYLLGK